MRNKKSYFNKSLKKFSKYGGAFIGGAAGTLLDYITSDVAFGGPMQKIGYKKGKGLFYQKPWGRSRRGHIVGSARNVTGSAPRGRVRVGPVYGSNPRPPVYGSPPLPKDPVVYKLEFLTPIVSPVEKWHKGRLC